MSDGGERPRHHPEAVIEGHRYTRTIDMRVAIQDSDEIPIIENVAVRESCSLRNPVVPELYWMLMASAGDNCPMRSFSAARDTASPASSSEAQPGVFKYMTASSAGNWPRTLATMPTYELDLKLVALMSRRQPACPRT